MYEQFVNILSQYLPNIYQPEIEYTLDPCISPGADDKYTNDFEAVYVYPWPGAIEVSLVFKDEDDYEIGGIYSDTERSEIYGSPTDIEHFFIMFDSTDLRGTPKAIEFPGSYYSPSLGYCEHNHEHKSIKYVKDIYVTTSGHSFADKGGEYQYIKWEPRLEVENGIPGIYYYPDKQEVNGMKLSRVPVVIGTYDDADIDYRQTYKKTRGIKIVNITINDDSFDDTFKDDSHWNFGEFKDYGITRVKFGQQINTKVYVWRKDSKPFYSVVTKVRIPDLGYDKESNSPVWDKGKSWWNFKEPHKYIYFFSSSGGVNVPGLHTMYVSTEVSLGMTRDKDVKTKTFCVISLPEIKSPTQERPVWVGSTSNPSRFTLRLFMGCPWTTDRNIVKEIYIGNKPATFTPVITNFKGETYLIVYPPTQEHPGKYDLEVKLFNRTTLVMPEAVEYGDGSGRNVDVAFIIDNSGSMSWNDPQGLRGQAVKMFIDQLDVGDAVSLISFEGWADVLVPLTLIDSYDTKQWLISQVRTWAGDGTSLSAGLKAGYQQLAISSTGNTKVAIMLTDGMGGYNNEAQLYKQAGWPVYTVGLGKDINPQLLTEIATETGGIYLHADKPEDIMQIYNIIKGKVKREQTLTSRSVKLYPGQSTQLDTYIDSSVKSASFGVTWPGSDINLTLIAPDGSLITPELAQDDPNITYTRGETYTIYTIKNPIPGKWTMNITAVDVSENGEDVTAMVLADTNLTVDLFTEKNTYKLNEPVRLVGVLTNNGEPIKGTVNATIITPSGAVKHLQLLDKNCDGVYETYYVPTEPGSYTIKLQAGGVFKEVPFTRENTFSIYVSSELVQESLKSSLKELDLSTVSGKKIGISFTVNSTASDIVRIGVTSLSSDNGPLALNYTVSPEVFSVVPDESIPVYIELTVPIDAQPGNYTGGIIVEGKDSSLRIPIKLEVRSRLITAPEDVDLYSFDTDIESVEVYELSEDQLKQIVQNIPTIENFRAFVVVSVGSGSYKLRISNINNADNTKVFKYNFEEDTWKGITFERGSVIVPLSVDRISIDLLIVGNSKTQSHSSKSKKAYINILTLSWIWSTWFFNYYDEFNELYANATALGADNETLQKALQLHNNATALIKDAWRTDDLEQIKTRLWKSTKIMPIPKFQEIRQAYLMEKEAVEILRNVLCTSKNG